MNKKTGHNFSEAENSSTELSENAYEGEESSSAVVAKIWREKIMKSGLFLPSEIDVIIPVWIYFMKQILPHHTNASAEEFYISAATTCAQQLKHFSKDGWHCFLMSYAPSVLKCFENSIEELEIKEPSLSSEESLCDVHTKVEFLLQLVTSSDVGLFLARKALNKAFTPNFDFAKSPQKLYTPRNYLDTNMEPLSLELIRKNLIYEMYDEEFILPLQIANEVSDEFWEKERAETSAQPRSSTKG